jgi:hypothetical protein
MEILLQKEKAEKFSKILQEATLIIVPDLYISELTNTLWKYKRANILTKNECVQYIKDGINYVDKFIDSKELWQEAFSEGVKDHRHSRWLEEAPLKRAKNLDWACNIFCVNGKVQFRTEPVLCRILQQIG